MSIKRMTSVWESSHQKETGLLIMLAIADAADDDGFAWPGFVRLAKRARTSIRNVSRLVKAAEDEGELIVNRRSILGKSNQYVVIPGLSPEEAAGTMKNRLRYPDDRIMAEIQRIWGDDILSGVTPRAGGDDSGSRGGMTPESSNPSYTHHSSPLINAERDDLDIAIFVGTFKKFLSVEEGIRWVRFVRDNGPAKSAEIVAWARKKKIHMENRASLLDSMETAALNWGAKKNGTHKATIQPAEESAVELEARREAAKELLK